MPIYAGSGWDGETVTSGPVVELFSVVVRLFVVVGWSSVVVGRRLSSLVVVVGRLSLFGMIRRL